MSLCVLLNPDGTVTATVDAPEQCQGYVLQSRTEYAASQTFTSFLAMPSTDQATAAFNVGVIWPVFFYLIAWGTGTIANFFNRK